MDCLVKLYNLPDMDYGNGDIVYRRVMAYEKTQLLSWVKSRFSANWADECSSAFSHQPISCFVAVYNGNIVGFACYDCTQKNFFGPMGVEVNARKRGIGRILLTVCLQAMKINGYAYAIIGGCDDQQNYYVKTVGAIPIEGSTPGIYSNRIKS